MSLTGKWGYSTNEETYFGNFDTKEEAIEEAEACEDEDRDYWVGQFRDVRIHVSGNSIVDQVAEDMYEEAGEFAADWPGHVSTGAMDQLTEVLTAAFETWLKHHKLMPTFAVVEHSTIERRSVPTVYDATAVPDQVAKVH